jgi:mono/diheme cytochrome c family protein
MHFRLKTISRARLAILFVATAALLIGCGPSPEPQFTPSPKTLQLLPEIRDGMTVTDEEGKQVHLAGVTEVVDRHFGKLTDPVIWPLLPVDFGGKPAKVAAVVSPTAEAAAKAAEEEKPLEELVLTLTGSGKEPLEASSGSQIAWAEGATYAGKAHRVKEFDAKTKQVTLVGTFDSGLPVDGDELLLEAGPTLAKGQALYGRHCLHCHGPGGAGDGPTAKYLDPKPRDYRLGLYKFTSTATPEKASRDDLITIMRRGVPGTSMPAFRLLESDDPQSLYAIAEYVRWLSIRGEYEAQLTAYPLAYEYTSEVVAKRVAEGEKREEIINSDVKGFLEGEFADLAEPTGEGIADAWRNSDTPEVVVTPTISRVADTHESRARGRELYLSDRTKCASCHGPYGRGDGPQSEAFQINSKTGQQYPLPGLYDEWGNRIKPRDLTQGIFRGGRRPIDLYRRLHAGIKGTPMPAFGGTLKEEEIWDLVNFVLHAPYEPLPEAGKGKALVSSTAH